MIAADRPERRSRRLLTVDALGVIRHFPRRDLATLLRPGDLVVANDAATLPASLEGTHERSGEALEIRLAGFVEAGDPTRFVAVVFGAGNYHTVTEDRRQPPTLAIGDLLTLGPLVGHVERILGHPRLISLRFAGRPRQIYEGLAAHGRPIQYAHVPEPLALWDVWTSFAVHPVAFESPSAGFALDWHTLSMWGQRGVEFATVTLAAGISSTGDPGLDARLPLDEPYIVPAQTAEAIDRTRQRGGRVIAIGTTVVRALEAAAGARGGLRSGAGVARQRIGPATRLKVVDVVLTGMHEPGESHYELLGAFADDLLLRQIHGAAKWSGYRSHEFGDSLMLERRAVA